MRLHNKTQKEEAVQSKSNVPCIQDLWLNSIPCLRQGSKMRQYHADIEI